LLHRKSAKNIQTSKTLTPKCDLIILKLKRRAATLPSPQLSSLGWVATPLNVYTRCLQKQEECSCRKMFLKFSNFASFQGKKTLLFARHKIGKYARRKTRVEKIHTLNGIMSERGSTMSQQISTVFKLQKGGF
jgi:hypothetical protein